MLRPAIVQTGQQAPAKVPRLCQKLDGCFHQFLIADQVQDDRLRAKYRRTGRIGDVLPVYELVLSRARKGFKRKWELGTRIVEDL